MKSANMKRIVIKVGSSLVTNNGEGLDHAAIAQWAEQMASLLQDGHEVLMVSSGAIAEGMQRLGWTTRPQEIHKLQAAAAVGQMGLVQVYESCFARFNLRSAQILLTNSDLAHYERNANAKATLETLLSLGVVPIINENDTVVTDEIKFGDNDNLAALVTNLTQADLLIILTDQGGLFTADPRQDMDATLLSEATAGDPALEKMAGGAGSQLSKGGMLTKVLAAKVAAQTEATTIIASGREPGVLTRLLAGENIGTRISAS
jgi:glutamate 5-kinase